VCQDRLGNPAAEQQSINDLRDANPATATARMVHSPAS
jgi:hypothetical protein